MIERLKYALFDLDQTLVDRRRATERLARILFDSDAINENNIDSEKAIKEFLRLDRDGAESDKLNLFTQLEQTWGGLKRSPSELADWLIAAPRSWYAPDESVSSFLADLTEQGVLWGVVTNGPPSQVDKGKITGVFEGSTCFVVSDLVGAAKPNSAIFNIALEKLGAPNAGQVLFVGDNPLADVIGASDVGMKTAWIRHGMDWPYTHIRPDHIVDSVLDCAVLFR